jgi:uncharacterized protein (DUF1778 family)
MSVAQSSNEASIVKDARFDTKLNSHIKETLKKAAMVEGTDLSSFIISAATEKAREVLNSSNVLVLQNEDFFNFLEAIEKPKKPTKELENLMQLDDLNER